MPNTMITFSDEEWAAYRAKHAAYFSAPIKPGQFDTLHKEPVSADYERAEEQLENEHTTDLEIVGAAQ